MTREAAPSDEDEVMALPEELTDELPPEEYV